MPLPLTGYIPSLPILKHSLSLLCSPNANDSPIGFIEEDKGKRHNKPPLPEGDFITNSTAYFPASKTTVTRKSQAPAQRAEQRAYQQKQ